MPKNLSARAQSFLPAVYKDLADAEYAARLEDFVESLDAQFGDEVEACGRESAEIQSATVALDRRRVELKARCVALRVARVAAGLHKFPAPRKE